MHEKQREKMKKARPNENQIEDEEIPRPNLRKKNNFNDDDMVGGVCRTTMRWRWRENHREEGSLTRWDFVILLRRLTREW